MLSQEYLKSRLVRLKEGEEWTVEPTQMSFVFAKGGSGRFVCGPISHRLASGDVLVANATTPARISAASGTEFIFWAFSLSFENLLPLFASKEISLLERVADEFKSAKLYAAASPLAAECHRLLLDTPPEADLAHRGQLLRIAAAILSVELKQVQRRHGGFVSVEKHLVQVFEALSSAEILNLSVAELAAKFGCSRRHLTRLFHQYFGFTVATLRMEMRLLKAVSLLRNPDAKIIIVAQECGFNHLGLFNTCFRRRFGSSPGQWRKMNQQPGGQTAGAVGATLLSRLQTGLPGIETLPQPASDKDSPPDKALASAAKKISRARQSAGKPGGNGLKLNGGPNLSGKVHRLAV